MAVLDRPPFSTEPPRPLTPEELQARWQAAYPEAAGPGQDTESGAVTYGGPPDPRIGAIPHLIDPETRDRENREREARWNALSPETRAAMAMVEDLVAQELRRR